MSFFCFFWQDQKEQEMITDYVFAICVLAATCNFAGLQERFIQDHVACGIQNKALQWSFLEDSKLTHKKCVDNWKVAE